MNITEWVQGTIDRRCKLAEFTVSGDGVSNIVTLHLYYKVPKFWDTKKTYAVTKQFYELGKIPDVLQDEVRVGAFAAGWANADGTLFKVDVQIMPNNGNLIYNSVIRESNDEQADFVSREAGC